MIKNCPCREGAKADQKGNVYFMPNPLLMADVKPGSSVPANTKGVVYYIDVGAKTIKPLPSTVGASGFTAVSITTAKSDGGGSCMMALGFPRPNLVTLLDPAKNAAYGSAFGPAYDFLVATPTSEGMLLKSKLNPAAASLVPVNYKSFGGAALTVSLNIYAANMVMGSASGDPLLYALFTAVDPTYTCSGNPCTGAICPTATTCIEAPYGDILLGIRVNLTTATGT